MKISVGISRGIETLFGTRDENIRMLEKNLGVAIRLRQDSLEIDGSDVAVARAHRILSDYADLTASVQTATLPKWNCRRCVLRYGPS